MAQLKQQFSYKQLLFYLKPNDFLQESLTPVLINDK